MSKSSECSRCECGPSKPVCECPLDQNVKHDELETLRAMDKFRKFYEDKLKQIDIEGGGDCTELKLKLQERWIKDLTEQTEMMAKIVSELEEEATTRVRMLEEKLKQSSKAAYEVMKRYQNCHITHNLDESFQRVLYLENDLKNLLEFLRRIRDEKKWSSEGLQFYNVTHENLFGKEQDEHQDIIEFNYDQKDMMVPSISLSNGTNFSDKEDSPSPDNGKLLSYEELLKKKNEEYESLKQTMLDMRSALTEEVACKHDMILALKKDVLQLEERCVQADKQTAFKDDIIKELRKEIKQLKQQEKSLNQSSKSDEYLRNILNRLQNLKRKIQNSYNQRKLISKKMKALEQDNRDKNKLLMNLFNVIKALLCKLHMMGNNSKEIIKKENDEKKSEEVEQLEKKLKEAEAKIRRMRPCVDVKSACTATDKLEKDEKDKEKEKEKEKELENEICCRTREVECLKERCEELQKALDSSQARGENLQKAVNLYLNSINVLEASEERSRIEIEQQRITINNLQDALVNVKHELDELRQKNQQEAENQHYIINVLFVNLLDVEGKNENLNVEISQLVDSYKKLQDYNFELEVEHFNSLQDVALLETQLHKYQNELRSLEASSCSARIEVRKLRRQKRCYEHMIECFKQEMAVMSEQLVNLQEILKISNEKCKEENCQLCCAVSELQQACDKLKSELKEAEKRNLVENKMNEVKEAKINELQLIIGQKNTELNVHDAAIRELKANLESAVIKNHELQATIAALNSTIIGLKCQCQEQKTEKSLKSNSVVESESASKLRKELEKKDKKLDKIHRDYVAQHEILKSLEEEFDKIKEKNRDKIKTLKRQNECLKEKLETTENNNKKMVEELSALKEQISSLARTDATREQELIQSKQAVIDLRQTMIELNENLTQSEMQQLVLAEEMKKKIKEDRKQEDIYLSCQCEIALYKKLVQNLNDAFVKMQKKLADIEAQNKCLIEELNHKEAKMVDLQKKLAKKEKESCQHLKELTEKLRKSREEERRLNHFIEKLKNEVQQKLKENSNKVKCICENVSKNEIVATKEEISDFTIEIKQMIQNQLALNSENASLIKQVSELRSTFNTLEERNRNLKQKNEKLQDENKQLKENNKILQREKEMFIQTIRNLEMELAEARSNRDDICAESRNVVNNVKAWLEEQKKINDKVKKKTQCYCDTITQLQEKNEKLQNLAAVNQEAPNKKKIKFRSYSPPPPDTNDCCPSPWSYDSQGNDTPRDSPTSLTCSVEEWYSPNYRDETDFDSDHDDNNFVTTLETVAVEMRNNNKKWKDNKYKECECMMVSKDDT